MELSLRLKTIISMIDKCETVGDIGTDHGYIPIYLLKNDICKKAIACDINKGPLKKAELNIKIEGLNDKIQLRLGPGFSVIKPYEINCGVLAGMGGNLIKNIIEDDIDVFKSLDCAVLQSPQNTEVLREYLYKKGFNILDEELCKDDGIYYETIKVKYDTMYEEVDPIYYEISKKLIQKNHPLLKDYIIYKINKYTKIKSFINDVTQNALNRKKYLLTKISKLEDILRCL